MGYNKEKLYKQAEKAIKDNNLFFIEDIVAFLPCDKTTFYRYFPITCNEYNELKDLLEQNKIKTKSEIRAKLLQGVKATELIALYKLICTNDERKMLSMQYIESKNKHSLDKNPFKEIRDNVNLDDSDGEAETSS